MQHDPIGALFWKHRTSLDRGAYFGEMALLSNRTRNATIRACTAMDVLIIPKIDFDKLRQSVPAFGNVFNKLAKQRAVTESPHSSQEPSILGGRSGYSTPIL